MQDSRAHDHELHSLPAGQAGSSRGAAGVAIFAYGDDLCP